MEINRKRIRKLNKLSNEQGRVLYWMSREQRVGNNWALLTAQKLAKNSDLMVVFNLVPAFLDATIRQYDFLLQGLKEVERNLRNFQIPFKLLLGNPIETLPNFIEENNISIVVMDFDPLKIKQYWKKEVLKKIDIPAYEVDANNIVPCWIASNKQEYAAYTIRPKINRLLPEFLTIYPDLQKQKSSLRFDNDWKEIYKSLKVNRSVKALERINPGENAAQKALKTFIHEKLDNYSNDRNDPTKEATSEFSIYLHYGQVSSQQIAVEVEKCEAHQASREAFLEELIIRNELADNFCFYNRDYDNPNGFSAWAKKSLKAHEMDLREYVYSSNTFENAETYDDLWNAAQKQLIATGKIHGYMRMYWAKKILEWSPNVDDAMKIAIYLNDKYALDGRDPRGYTGIAWSIGGIHDRAWTERNVFGKIRYMNYNGCKRKFDVKKYIEKWQSKIIK